MKLRSPDVKKGIAFAGCSFTWGQGLHYYSNMSSLVELPLNIYDPNFVEFSHKEFIKRKRFARQVADYFDMFEVVKYENGGSLDAILDYWKNVAFEEVTVRTLAREHNPSFRGFDPCDIKYFVLQCTYWTRSNIELNFNGYSTEQKQLWELLQKDVETVKLFLHQRNITLDDFLTECQQSDVNRYKELLQYLENKGIKTFIMTWPPELVPFITKDDWLSDRMIKFNYKNNTYDSIEELIKNNAGLTIEQDLEYFEIPPTDNHPSLQCHKIIAESIINSIKETQ